jgi:hypothetical protein
MPSTPAMTTGTMDFMTSSGRITPIDAMPTPALAVPYAAPKPARREGGWVVGCVSGGGWTGSGKRRRGPGGRPGGKRVVWCASDGRGRRGRDGVCGARRRRPKRRRGGEAGGQRVRRAGARGERDGATARAQHGALRQCHKPSSQHTRPLRAAAPARRRPRRGTARGTAPQHATDRPARRRTPAHASAKPARASNKNAPGTHS